MLILLTLQLVWTKANGQEGQKLFNDHCGICHDYSKVMTGPPITFISDYKDFEWFVSFKRNPLKFYATDEDRYTRLMLDYYSVIYGIDPPVDLSEAELRQIWDFLIELQSQTIRHGVTDSLRQSWVK